MAFIISYNTTAAALSFPDNRFSKPFILNNRPSSSVFFTGAKKCVTGGESCNGFSSGRSFFSGELKRSSLPKYLEKWGSVVGGVRSSKNDNAFAVESAEYVVEPSTNVKFQTSLNLPGCSDSLVLIGTGYREKVFAIIGVKVYAAGFYANKSVMEKLESWKGKTSAEIQVDSSLYDTIFQAPMEKSLQIVLVRDVDGKTFWDALNDAISPRIKAPTPVDESALSTFRSTFEGRPLKKGTLIFLTWVDPSKMLVCISSDGLPSTVDATTESKNVSLAFFDVFFGDTPVSPSLKTSVSNGLAVVLN